MNQMKEIQKPELVRKVKPRIIWEVGWLYYIGKDGNIWRARMRSFADRPKIGQRNDSISE